MQIEEAIRRGMQNEKHYSKENNTSENQSQDKKFQTSRPREVRRSGQVRSGQVTTFVVCAVFSLSFQAVVLRELL